MWGRLGVCGSAAVPPFVVSGGFGAVVFGKLLRLELEGSREGILYDETYLTILNSKIIVYFIMPKYFEKCYYRHEL